MQPHIMGIVNVTPDSFSDGGQFATSDDAIAYGLLLTEQGAAIIDVGGESTRPGHTPVAPAEEMRRVLPVVEGLVQAGVCVSVDTRHDETARAARAAGATYVNRLIDDTRYELVDAHDEVVAVDPGFGFVETYEDDLRLWAGLDDLVAQGTPVMVGISRKRLTRRISGITDPHARDEASAQLAAAAVAHGVAIVRTHNVEATVAAVAEHADATAYLALGSNLGDRHAHIDEAIARLDNLPLTRVAARSSIIETTPETTPGASPDTPLPDFLNAAVRLETALGPFALFTEMQAIEVTMGRPASSTAPDPATPRTPTSRIIDLDLIAYETARGPFRHTTPELTVPHPRAAQRPFVARPLAEVLL
ncbi:MAG: 2-amino-4-hydroxy-6-hydroxymethyldihydropteridine diphosphokinase [Coriobacteriia bacterium]|nr:2-amino-4-hydroxy-6-hydroxymethyldihydropteridine diphosphokinase [Coriobacteriia bacterium]